MSGMSLKDIEMAIPKLSPQELRELREWLEDFCEDQLEFSEETEGKLRQAEQEIRTGEYRVRHTP